MYFLFAPCSSKSRWHSVLNDTIRSPQRLFINRTYSTIKTMYTILFANDLSWIISVINWTWLENRCLAASNIYCPHLFYAMRRLELSLTFTFAWGMDPMFSRLIHTNNGLNSSTSPSVL